MATQALNVSGGPPVTICNAPPAGGSWGQDNRFSLPQRQRGPLERINIERGEGVAVTGVGLAQKEDSHRLPQILPAAIASSLDVQHQGHSTLRMKSGSSRSTGGSRKRSFADPSNGNFRGQGYLLYVRESSLLGSAFDVESARVYR